MNQESLLSESETFLLRLQQAALRFFALAEVEPKNYLKKLRNSTTLFVFEPDSLRAAPLPWLLHFMEGGSWLDTAYGQPTSTLKRQLSQSGLLEHRYPSPEFEIFREAYVEQCMAAGNEPSLGNRQPGAYNRLFFALQTILALPDEEEQVVAAADQFEEGATSWRLNKVFERDSAARQECLRLHGSTCAACEFDFAKTYGSIGRGFMHVHHKKPLSLVQEVSRVNPQEDLVPLCPNCHAMIHRMKDPADVNALKELLSANAQE